MPRISVAQLFEDNCDRLRLAWIAGRDGGAKELDPGNLKDSHEGLIGHLNVIPPSWIQVIARPELAHLNSLDPADAEKIARNIFFNPAARDWFLLDFEEAMRGG